MRYRLRTLLITVTAAATCGGWAMALDAVRKGQVNFVQMLVLAFVWGIGILLLVPRR